MEASPQRRGMSPRRKKGLIRLAIAVGVLFVVLVGSSFVAAEYTSRSAFCDSCHEMNPYYKSWQASKHHMVPCKGCHIPHTPVGWVKTKVFALREVYVHFTGGNAKPIVVTRRVPDSACTGCHPTPGTVKLATSTFNHATHRSESCATCHSRVSHPGVPLSPNQQGAIVDPAAMPACTRCHNGTTAPNGCEYCHKTAPHSARGKCDKCHGVESWLPKDMKHPFPLEGVHATIACERCHRPGSGLGPIPGTQLTKAAGTKCSSCHKAPHPDRGPCSDCHGFDTFKFKHPFALTGAHAGVECAKCHPKDSAKGLLPGTSLGRPKGTDCIDCHGDHHQGLKDCTQCHTTKGWSPADFSHPPAGQHSPTQMQCTLCHPNGYGSVSCTCHGGGTQGGD